MQDLKSEKGAITLFVLLGMLFFMVVVTTMFFRTSNQNSTQEGDIRAIESQYTVTDEKLQNKYDEIKNKEINE